MGKKKKEIVAYVIDARGVPMMPIRSHGRVRKMLRSGRARIVRKVPFTIQLNEEMTDAKTDFIILGIDPGRTNIGLCAIDSRGRILYASDIETRNKMIARLMLTRKRLRQASRRGERLRRKRRAKKNHTLKHVPASPELGFPEGIGGLFARKLPQCKKFSIMKDIINTEARFCNRKREKGWLTPTANQLLQTHQSAVRLVLKILPVSCIVLELNKFSFARMENPEICGEMYQNGPMKGFATVEQAVFSQQEGHCLLCKKGPIDVCHHIVPKSKGGTDVLANRAGLCKRCHEKVHKDPKTYERMVKKKKGLEKKYGALSVLNQIIPHLWDWLNTFDPSIPAYAARGWETKKTREAFDLPKEHYVDAWCIAVDGLFQLATESDPSYGAFLDIDHSWKDSFLETIEVPGAWDPYHIIQFRRHDRAQINHVTKRIYKYDGEQVATNRHKAIVAVPKENKDGEVIRDENGQAVMVIKGQASDSLEEFRKKMEEQHGKDEAEKIISRLKAEPATVVRNNMDRILPGAVFKDKKGHCFVMKSQQNGGERYNEAVAGATAYNSRNKELKKELKKQLTVAQNEGDAEKVSALQAAIDSIVPLKNIGHQVHGCELLLHNTGLVYVTQSIEG